MRNDNPFKILSTKTVYKNPWIEVIEDKIIHPDKGEGIYATVKTHGSVMIVPVNEKGEIFMTRCFSYPAKKWHWGLPGGGCGDDDYETAARKELLEEAGIEAGKMIQVGLVRPLDGIIGESQADFIAWDLRINEAPKADDNSLIDQRKFFSLDEIHKMVASGDIDSGHTLAALYYYELWLRAKE